MKKIIPYQVNDGGIVALIPDGRVEFFDSTTMETIKAINSGEKNFNPSEFDEKIIFNPFVDLDNFKLSAPAIAFIEITNLCNLRCKHCYAFSGPKRKEEMTTEEILHLLDHFEETGVLQVFLTGGEVFSHPEALRIINHARTKSFSTQIFTNGILITEEILAQIPRGTSFFISFDTADPVRSVRGGMDFPILKEKFSLMRKYGHVFRTAISVHQQNIDDVEEIFEWCQINRYPRPQWLETHPIGRALIHPHILIPAEEVERIFLIYKRCMDRYSTRGRERDEDSEDSEKSDDLQISERKQKVQSIQTIKFCQRLEKATGREKCSRSLVYINSAGEVFPCSNCMSNRSYAGGNIKTQDFKSIWEKGFQDFRQITFSDFSVCQICPVEKSGTWCQFRCPPLAKNVSKDPSKCGATDYLKLFMLKSEQYWRERELKGVQLQMNI